MISFFSFACLLLGYLIHREHIKHNRDDDGKKKETHEKFYLPKRWKLFSSKTNFNCLLAFSLKLFVIVQTLTAQQRYWRWKSFHKNMFDGFHFSRGKCCPLRITGIRKLNISIFLLSSFYQSESFLLITMHPCNCTSSNKKNVNSLFLFLFPFSVDSTWSFQQIQLHTETTLQKIQTHYVDFPTELWNWNCISIAYVELSGHLSTANDTKNDNFISIFHFCDERARWR